MSSIDEDAPINDSSIDNFEKPPMEKKKLDSIVMDPSISESETVIVKAITHRGTQTTIQCNPNVTKEDFIDMVILARL